MSVRRLLLPALLALATALLALPAGATDTPGAAYVLSNSPAGNSVLVFAPSARRSAIPSEAATWIAWAA